jgi:Cu/Ag efflux protein CusF
MRLTLLILLSAVAFSVLFLPSPLRTQQQEARPRSLAFFGRVESIDAERKVVTVKHGKIAGYTDSGTSEYSVDEEASLKGLQPGGDIRAIVYPNDLTLHQIHVVYRRAGKQGKTSK